MWRVRGGAGHCPHQLLVLEFPTERERDAREGRGLLSAEDLATGSARLGAEMGALGEPVLVGVSIISLLLLSHCTLKHSFARDMMRQELCVTR